MKELQERAIAIVEEKSAGYEMKLENLIEKAYHQGEREGERKGIMKAVATLHNCFCDPKIDIEDYTNGKKIGVISPNNK